jgi:tRNA threonylcarbamoyladenosine biosynthesis protein TsaE
MSLSKKLIHHVEIKNPDGFSDLVSFLRPKITSKTCVLLNGDLAAGKTTFVDYFCRSFGLQNAASPTFAIHSVYENENAKIDHFDLYRLNCSDDIETSGLWETFTQPKFLIFIEWATRISLDEIPLGTNCFEIDIEKTSETNRKISVFSID